MRLLLHSGRLAQDRIADVVFGDAVLAPELVEDARIDLDVDVRVVGVGRRWWRLEVVIEECREIVVVLCHCSYSVSTEPGK
ncbi:MAG: hypothetical protein A2V63_06180 [Candidatus Eisenbacteria bacterium RBG_19FT_COMBO_70_11]|nr:MAG: hypothetical protein A2V63_06180 [Candidatus Eisenbacteria bacterium RBG_19FT_COMBO_70_11]